MMELNKASKAIVRQWIAEKRIALVNQISALRAQVETFNRMLEELEQDMPVPVVVASTKRKPRKKYGKRKEHTVFDAALLALDAAGASGLTAKELAAVAHVPANTASARLSIMKSEGLIRHVSPKYFIVHSKQQDNNMDQGA